MRALQQRIRETMAAQRMQKIIRGHMARRQAKEKSTEYDVVLVALCAA